MKKTALLFAALLAICLIIGACTKQAEVEKPAETIPEPVAEQTPDTAVLDTGAVPDTVVVDTTAKDTTAGQ